MPVKNILIVLLLALTLSSAVAQRKGDVGVFTGYCYYLGEVNTLTQFKSPVYSYGVIYRHSFNLRYSLRGSIFNGKVQGYDNLSSYSFNRLRDHQFVSSITDVTLQLEFNFLPYITTSSSYNFTTYVTSGLSYFFTDNAKVNKHFAFPFGVGIKVNLTKRMSAGAELVLRKTSTDEIDGLGKPDKDPLTDPYISSDNLEPYRQRSLPNRSDLYAFGGIFITYKMFYNRTRCPAYDDNSFKE